MSAQLILYSKPGCHLCEGLEEKLAQLQHLNFELEIRDITTRDDWFQAYQYEIPVLVLVKRAEGGEESGVRRQEAGEGDMETRGQEAVRTELTQNSSSLNTPHPTPHTPSLSIPLPRLSPRATVRQLEQMLQKYL